MQKALLILTSAVIITGFIAFLYLFGGDTHTFSVHFDLDGEQLVFPEPPDLVYKATVQVTGTLSCSTQFQMIMDKAPYTNPIALPAGEAEKVLYNGDCYAGSDLGLSIRPQGESCPDNKLKIKVVYYD
ncbi:MAG: hypothetical protein AAFP77_24035 [Bacteroidota bacterium]